MYSLCLPNRQTMYSKNFSATSGAFVCGIGTHSIHLENSHIIVKIYLFPFSLSVYGPTMSMLHVLNGSIGPGRFCIGVFLTILLPFLFGHALHCFMYVVISALSPALKYLCLIM